MAKILLNVELQTAKAVQGVKELETAFQGLVNKLNSVKPNKDLTEQLKQTAKYYNSIARAAQAASKAERAQQQAIKATISAEREKAKAEDDTLKRQKRATQETEKAAKANKSYAAGIKDMIAGFTQWQIAATLVMKPLNWLKQALSSINETLVETENRVIALQRVLPSGSGTDKDIADKLYNMAIAYGQTFENVSDIATNFARTGMDWAATIEATEAALLALNVAELNATQASDGLIAVLSQFNLEATDLESVVDKLNKTADRFPVTTEKLLAALQRTGSSAANANLELEETIGLITALSKATGRSGENIGTALNSLLQYSSKDTALETFASLSDEVEAVVNSFRTGSADILDVWTAVSKEINHLTDQQADLLDEYFNTEEGSALAEELGAELGDIYNDLSGVYSTANTFRKNYFIALLQNIDTAHQAAQTAYTAQGYSQKENSEFMRTYTAQVNALKAEWKKLANDEQGILALKKLFVDLGVGALKVLDAIGGIKTVLILIGLQVSRMAITRLIDRMTIAWNLYAGAQTIAATAVTGFGVALKTALPFLTTVLSLIALVVNASLGYNEEVKQAGEQARAEAAAKRQETITAWQGEADAITDTAAAYHEYLLSIDDSISAEEKEKSAIENLLPVMDEKYAGLANLKKGTDDYTKALEDNLIQQIKNDKYKAQQAYKDAKIEANSGFDNSYTYGFSLDSAFITQFYMHPNNRDQIDLQWRRELRRDGIVPIRGFTPVDYDNAYEAYNGLAALLDSLGREDIRYYTDSDGNAYDVTKTKTYGEILDKYLEVEALIQPVVEAGIQAYMLQALEDGKAWDYTTVLNATNTVLKELTGEGLAESILNGSVSASDADLSTFEQYVYSIANGYREAADGAEETGDKTNELEDATKEAEEAARKYAEAIQAAKEELDKANELAELQKNLEEAIAEAKKQYLLDIVDSYIDQMEEEERQLELQELQNKVIEARKNALQEIVETQFSALLEAEEEAAELEERQTQAVEDREKALSDYVSNAFSTYLDELERAATIEEHTLSVIEAQQNALISALEERREKEEEALTLEERRAEIEQSRLDHEKNRLEVEQRQLEVEKAKDALIKARNQKTVRVYNSQTGRFEGYTANAKDVQSAEEALQSAKVALNDSQKAVRDSEQTIKDREADYNAYVEDMMYEAIYDYIRNSENGTVTMAELLPIVKTWGQELLGDDYKNWRSGIESELVEILENPDIITNSQEVLEANSSWRNYLKEQAVAELSQAIADGLYTEESLTETVNRWVGFADTGEQNTLRNELLDYVEQIVRYAQDAEQAETVKDAEENFLDYIRESAVEAMRQSVAEGKFDKNTLNRIIEGWVANIDDLEQQQFVRAELLKYANAIGGYAANADVDSTETVQSAISNLNDFLKKQMLADLKTAISDGSISSQKLFQIVRTWLGATENNADGKFTMTPFAYQLTTALNTALKNGSYDQGLVQDERDALTNFYAERYWEDIEEILTDTEAQMLRDFKLAVTQSRFAQLIGEELAAEIMDVATSAVSSAASGKTVKMFEPTSDKDFNSFTKSANISSGAEPTLAVATAKQTKTTVAKGGTIQSVSYIVNGVPISTADANNYTIDELFRNLPIVSQ